MDFHSVFFPTQSPSNFSCFPQQNIATFVTATLGFFHNLLFLAVAYQLDWFRFYQFYLISNQIIADIATTFFWGLNSAGGMATCYWPSLCCSGGLDYVSAALVELPETIALDLCQKSALMIGIDRLFLLLYPLKWIRLTSRYRFLLISIAWTWSIVQKTWPILYSLLTHIVDEPHWLYDYMWSSCIVVSSFIIIINLIICFSSSSFCSRVINGQTQLSVYWSGMEKYQRKIVVRVGTLSVLTLLSHMCMLLGYLVVFATPQDVGTTLVMLSTIWPLYVCAWKDKRFREKLKIVLRSTFCCAWKQKTSQ